MGKGSSSSSSSSSSDKKHHKKDKKHGDKKKTTKKAVLRKEDFTALKHDTTKLGGVTFTKSSGIYGVAPTAPAAAAAAQPGAQNSAAAVHEPIGASALAHALESFPAPIQQRVRVLATETLAAPPPNKSALSGRKRALLIGINYTGTPNQLKGCHNDVARMDAFITEHFAFPTDAASRRTLSDAPGSPASAQPTRANIEAALRWLVEGAQAGDSLFFHYSGHGGTQIDEGPVFDEPTGMDETLVPSDFTTAGMLTDDAVHELLIAPLPPSVRLTAVTDCCHSGSILDLPFSFVLPSAQPAPSLVDNRQVALATALAQGATFGASADASGVAAALAADAVTPHALLLRTAQADVVHFSGCRDDQTAADAVIDGQPTGAMTHALVTSFAQFGKAQTFAQLLGHMRDALRGKYKQVPMLSTGYEGGVLNEVFKL